jgi:dipeptidyl aminopeptidase/acylaminoacyl peptidase
MIYRAGLCFLAVLLTGPPQEPRPQADPTLLGIPFQRYTVKDSLGRTITFYLSEPPKEGADGKLPVVLLVPGSGCQSLFRKLGDKVVGGLQNLLLPEAMGRARILVVEKPGVKYLDSPARPGSAQGASEEFLKEHTLPHWTEANRAALRAAWTLPGVDSSRTLAVGHSEGGIVVARLAAEEPRVTHVASLSAGGPTQLFDLAESQGRARPGDKPGDAARRRQQVYDEWARIRKDPESITKFWLGHPYRRWASFLPHSVTEELLRSKARIYLAQGTADTTIPVHAHDVLVAELRARGRDVTAERLEGADHGFHTAEMPPGPPAGMQAVFGRMLAWFLERKK